MKMIFFMILGCITLLNHQITRAMEPFRHGGKPLSSSRTASLPELAPAKRRVRATVSASTAHLDAAHTHAAENIQLKKELSREKIHAALLKTQHMICRRCVELEYEVKKLREQITHLTLHNGILTQELGTARDDLKEAKRKYILNIEPATERATIIKQLQAELATARTDKDVWALKFKKMFHHHTRLEQAWREVARIVADQNQWLQDT